MKYFNFLCLLLTFATPSISCAIEQGFVPLFDGKTLNGWTGEAKQHFDVKSGTMFCRKGCQGKLLTEREYSDFILRFDFKLTPGANNGLAIRAPKQGDAAYVGMELQILDNTAEKFKDLKPYQYHGSIYGVVPAKRGALKPVGKWNSQEVHCQGNAIKVILNGKVILKTEVSKVAPQGKTIDGQEHPGLKRLRGHLGFLCHGDTVYFRNIQIKDLTPPTQSKPKGKQ